MSSTLLLIAAALGTAQAQGDVPVPSACTGAVNQKLAQLIHDRPRGYVENVMACGTAKKTVVNSGGKHGSHHIITLQVPLPSAGSALVQIAINDSLDGAVSASPGDSVFAYGQGYTTSGETVAGIHDVHCSTHPGADNGWVVVNGNKTPASCSGQTARRSRRRNY